MNDLLFIILYKYYVSLFKKLIFIIKRGIL